MADITSNITVDITGNTASIGTDYGTDGEGLSLSHVSLAKVLWGDSTESKRVSLTDPLPIQFAGQTETTTITGTINGGNTGFFAVRNYGTDGSGSSGDLHYIAVAGSTNGVDPIGITGQIQGIPGGEPLSITGDILILGSMATTRPNHGGILIQGTSAGATATVAGEVYPGYGHGVPIAVTGGRRLDYTEDTITVVGTIRNTGGRELTAATDAVSCYGYDQGNHVFTRTFGSSGEYLGVSGDALKVAVTNGNFTINATIDAEIGVTNGSGLPLRVQGYTAGSGGDPVIIRGENDGALEITATSALNTSVSNTVSIDDDDIITSLESNNKPLIGTLEDIESGTNNISAIRSDLTSGNVKAIISTIERPSDLRSGVKTVTAIASQLDTNLEMRSGVTIKVDPTARENVLIGDKGLLNRVDSGYLLEPGESIFIEINNLSKIFLMLAGNNGSAKVYYIGT